MDRNKREKRRRQATAAAVAAVASASVMVGGILPDDGAFDNGAEDFPTPVVETVPLRGAGGDAPGAETALDGEEEKRRARRAASSRVTAKDCASWDERTLRIGQKRRTS